MTRTILSRTRVFTESPSLGVEILFWRNTLLSLAGSPKAKKPGVSRLRGDLLFVTVGGCQEVVEGQEAAEDKTWFAIKETEPQEVGVDEADERAHGELPGDLLEPAFEPLNSADRLRNRVPEKSLGFRGFPDCVSVVFLDPGGDRGVRVVFESILEPSGVAVQLYVLVSLIIAGTATGEVRHLLVATQSVFEQTQVPA